MSAPAIYGIIGYPLKHSLSPLMHNAAFNALKVNAVYKTFELQDEAELKLFFVYHFRAWYALNWFSYIEWFFR